MPNDAPDSRAGSQFEPLTFDASAAPGAAACSRCGATLRGSYHMIGDSMACAKCRYAAQSQQQGGDDGSAVVRAIGYGLAVAAAGALIDYAYALATGDDVPIVVILVAYAAGLAVRKASGGRGGRKFQVIAMVMAYIAMGAAFVPLAASSGRSVAQSIRSELIASSQARIDSITAANPEGADLDSASEAAMTAARTTLRTAKDFKVSLKQQAAALLVALFGAPIFISLVSPIYGLFVALALYRAWKRNAGDGSSPEQVTVSGPFRLQQAP